jgi:putative nucleotidyltransferase with HDIG domain
LLQVLEALTSAVERKRLAARHAAVFVRLSKLPPFHATALKLMNISVEGESAMEDFENAFRSDPSLTADLLLVANSAEFGVRSRIETIRHAITFIGLERIRTLGCTIAFSFYVRNLPRSVYMRTAWSHSIATAAIAELIGNLSQVPEMYTAGLVHDLGRMALFLSAGEEYATMLSGQFDSVKHSNEVETRYFGMDHEKAGALVGKEWQFPETLRAFMARHHDGDGGPATKPLGIVQLACRMADAVGFPEVDRRDIGEEPNLPERLRGREELTKDYLQSVVTRQIAAVGG